LTRRIIDSTRRALREFTGDQLLAVELFGIGTGEVDKWISVSPSVDLREEWFTTAKMIFHELQETFWEGTAVVGDIDNLAQQEAIPDESVSAARAQGIRGIAARPVRVIDDDRSGEPAYVLLVLASQVGVFADILTCHLLSQAVGSLEVAIQIGLRDDMLMSRPHE
jgi:hypothetical protein